MKIHRRRNTRKQIGRAVLQLSYWLYPEFFALMAHEFEWLKRKANTWELGLEKGHKLEGARRKMHTIEREADFLIYALENREFIDPHWREHDKILDREEKS